MIHIDKNQAQFSAWGHYADPKSLHINKTPEPFRAGDIVDASATRAKDGVTLTMSDGVELLLHDQQGMLPPLEDVTVWAEPAEGTEIPNGLDYVTIYASWTSKHGKVLTTSTDVPVGTPSEMRIVVGESKVEGGEVIWSYTGLSEPNIKEGQYLNTRRVWLDTDDYRGIQSAFAMSSVHFFIYWKNTDGVLVAITEAFDVNPYDAPVVQGGWSPDLWLQLGDMSGNGDRTIMRYYDPDPTVDPIEVELHNVALFYFSHTIRNITLYAESYFQTDPIVGWGFYRLPTSYSTPSETVTLQIEKHTRVLYGESGEVFFTRLDATHQRFLPIYFRTPTMGGGYIYSDDDTVIFANGGQGSLREYSLRTYDTSLQAIYKVDNKQYNCSGGQIVWTDPSES